MSWVKRNLYFLIGGIIALVLLGGAGWYLYSKWDLNNTNLGNLNQAYADLKALNDKSPNPGGENIKIAKEQRKELLDYIGRTQKYFQRIPPIPDLPKTTDGDFARALNRTIDQLRRDSTNASVNLSQDNYNFSFQAEKLKINFDQRGLEPLSKQLGEVKAICDILFQARINALDGLRRERASGDDSSGPATDYLGENATTNTLAILTPYELTFRCFSPELAAVLSGFASSPYGLIVKTINVEVAGTLPTEMAATPTPIPVAATPVYTPPPVQPTMSAEAIERARYGDMGRYGSGGNRYGEGGGKFPGYPAQPQPQYVQPAVAAAKRDTGLPVVVDEKQLKVTMQLVAVKMINTNLVAANK
jgi:hypothetical protein